MIKTFAAFLALFALVSTHAFAMKYMSNGVAYDTPEEMLAAQQKTLQSAEAAISRLAVPISSRRLLVITPSLNMIFAVNEMFFNRDNGRKYNDEEKIMYFNLAKSNYATILHKVKVIQLSGIYAGYDFQEQTAFQFSPPEPDNSRDILWLRQPEKYVEVAQWMYIDSRNGRQVMLYDITGATHQEHDRAFLDVIKGKAIRQ